MQGDKLPLRARNSIDIGQGFVDFQTERSSDDEVVDGNSILLWQLTSECPAVTGFGTNPGACTINSFLLVSGVINTFAAGLRHYQYMEYTSLS